MPTLETNDALKLRKWWEGYHKEFQESKGSAGWPMAPERIRSVLKENNIPYRVISNREVYTGSEQAAGIQIPGRKVAKVVIIGADGRYVMAVLPAHRRLDLARFAEVIRAVRLSLTPEAVLEKLFPDCELGAMPPLGQLYDFRVFVDEALTQEPEIFFQPGTHHEMIGIAFEDFERLVRPEKGQFASEPGK